MNWAKYPDLVIGSEPANPVALVVTLSWSRKRENGFPSLAGRRHRPHLRPGCVTAPDLLPCNWSTANQVKTA